MANEFSMVMKRCTRCGKLKSIGEFGKDKNSKKGIKSACKECHNEYAHQRYIRDREKCLKIANKYREKNREMLREKYRQWYSRNRGKCIEKVKQWAIDNPNKIWRINNLQRDKENNQKWRAENSERILERNRKYRIEHHEQCLNRSRKWRDENPEISRRWKREHPERVLELGRKWSAKIRGTTKGKLNNNISRAINHSLNGSKAGRHWEDLVGYTINQLKRHIEKLFKYGMTWDNYGVVWEIDHKIPIAVFNFEKPDQIDFRLCWSLKNLQPLEIKKNASKGAKLEEHFQPSLKLNVG